MAEAPVTGRGKGNGTGCPEGDGQRRISKALATAHEKGRVAFEAGVARSSCPYQGGMAQKFRIHWLAGWDEAEKGLDHVVDLFDVQQRPEYYGLTRGQNYGAVRGLSGVR